MYNYHDSHRSSLSMLMAFVLVNLVISLALLQVILVGHSSGGACVSYALEHFSRKILKAVFLCATMVSDGQRPFDVFAEEVHNQCLLPVWGLYFIAYLMTKLLRKIQ